MTDSRRRHRFAGRAVSVTAIAIALTATGLPRAHATAPRMPTPDRDCVSVDDTVVSNGRVAGCLDLSLANARYQAALGTSGLGWVDIGTATPPQASQCEAGTSTREDGWLWTCTVRNGQHVLVKTRPWARPAQLVFSHTASPTRSVVNVSSTSSLKGCRLTASDPRLLAGQSTGLSGPSAQRTFSSAKVKPGRYRLGVTCRDSRLNASGDLLVRANRSSLLRSDCLDAWHDATYGDVVPGYGRRLDPAAATTTTTECTRLAPLTADEYARADREAYLRIGQIAERQVRRVSAALSIPVCQAVAEVFKPVDTVGRLVSPTPSAALGITVPVAGYRLDGFFPVLYRQWTDGPVAMANTVDCSGGNQSLRLMAGTWATCPGNSNGVDPHQMYPTYAMETAACPDPLEPPRNRGSVCVVWGTGIGNDVVGGTGKVFVAEALQASPTKDSRNPVGDLTYDCQDRALKRGQFADVDVTFAPTLG